MHERRNCLESEKSLESYVDGYLYYMHANYVSSVAFVDVNPFESID